MNNDRLFFHFFAPLNSIQSPKMIWSSGPFGSRSGTRTGLAQTGSWVSSVSPFPPWISATPLLIGTSCKTLQKLAWSFPRLQSPQIHPPHPPSHQLEGWPLPSKPCSLTHEGHCSKKNQLRPRSQQNDVCVCCLDNGLYILYVYVLFYHK